MRYSFTVILILIGFHQSLSQIEKLLGEPRHKIEELKSTVGYNQALTGDYYTLAFSFEESTSNPLIGLRFDFDTSVANNNTLCQAITA